MAFFFHYYKTLDHGQRRAAAVIFPPPSRYRWPPLFIAQFVTGVPNMSGGGNHLLWVSSSSMSLQLTPFNSGTRRAPTTPPSCDHPNSLAHLLRLIAIIYAPCLPQFFAYWRPTPQISPTGVLEPWRFPASLFSTTTHRFPLCFFFAR